MRAWVMAFLGAIDGALLLRFANKDDTLVLGNPAIFPPPSAALRVSTAQLAYHAWHGSSYKSKLGSTVCHMLVGLRQSLAGVVSEN